MTHKYAIFFNLKGPRNSDGSYPKAAWPILFPTWQAADTAMRTPPIFANVPAKQHRKPGDIKSASVERVLVRPKWKNKGADS